MITLNSLVSTENARPDAAVLTHADGKPIQYEYFTIHTDNHADASHVAISKEVYRRLESKAIIFPNGKSAVDYYYRSNNLSPGEKSFKVSPWHRNDYDHYYLPALETLKDYSELCVETNPILSSQLLEKYNHWKSVYTQMMEKYLKYSTLIGRGNSRYKVA